ncbi:MAG: hypothetical protein AB1813_01270 [Verrucomicrobiota bacterium]
MASQFDESDFVDSDYQAAHKSAVSTLSASPPAAVAGRPPTREELESQVSEAHQRLSELKRAQEELERERAALEEARRRRIEFQTGREEMVQHLTRGVELLEQSEFAARREAEQMAKNLTGLREALANIQAIHEENWTQENWNTELTRALTTIENARMEWNGARLKWPLLDGPKPATEAAPKQTSDPAFPLGTRSFWQLCKLGLALTWPVALVALAGLSVIIVLLLQR